MLQCRPAVSGRPAGHRVMRSEKHHSPQPGRTEPEFIALESRPEALVTGGQFTISDHYIGVYRKNSETPFKLFDRATGKYLRDIGGIGRGPGEYISISSAQLDEAGGKVWISTIDRHNIYGYDIASGRLVADIKLPYKADNNTNNGSSTS